MTDYALQATVATDGKIFRRQLQLINANMKALVAGNVIGTLMLSAMMLRSHPWTDLAVWVLAVWTLTVVRYWVATTHDRQLDSSENLVPIARAMTFMAALAGLLWGAAAYFFLDLADPINVALMSLCLAAMVSSPVASYSAYPPVYFGFALPLLAFHIPILLIQGSADYLYIAISLIAFLIINCAFCFNIHRTIRSSIELQFTNDDLLGQLQTEHQAAVDANVAKSKFLAATSHDLRQPLHAMSLLMSALESGARGDDKARSETMVSLKKTQTELVRMFDTLLDISRLEAGDVQQDIEHLDIATTLSPLEPEFRQAAEQKGLAFKFDVQQAMVETDPVLLQRVIRNLLANAIKFTDRGYVHLEATKHGDQIQLRIADSGSGIPDEELEDIFDEYYQVGNPERDRSKGLGLGLSIVKKICDVLGVEIDVQSTVESGTQVTVAVPLSQDQQLHETRIGKAPLEKPSFDGQTVAIIEDEVLIRDVSAAQMRDRGLQVLAGENVIDILEQAHQTRRRPDFILSDFRLKGTLDGLQVIERLRLEFNEVMPALIITGDTTLTIDANNLPEKCKLLRKPADTDMILAELAAL